MTNKGKGLNSIPIRFALMSGMLAILCVAVQLYLWVGIGIDAASIALIVAISVLAILVPTTVTFLAANKLTNYIRALRRSTDAIVAGSLDSPVDVDCACEVGGLADSFRKMVGRLNANIVRMNVLAYTDPVTNLPNRAVVMHMLGHMTAPSNAGKGALLFIDLDGFKKVNDTLSHEAGDEMLRQASLRIIRQGLKRAPEQLDACTTPFGELCDRAPTDIVFARFAGDEFVALLPGITDTDALSKKAHAVLKALETPFDIGGNIVTVSASIGIARTPVDSTDPAELLNFADLAMYAAKQAGRSRFVFFDPSLRDTAIERNEIEADLRLALRTDELTLHYQPKLDTRTLECVGVEALLRWHHPRRGDISPEIFIPVAEQAGLMPALGASILRMAAQQSRIWLDAGVRRKVAINVSPAQFERPNLVSEVLAALVEYRVDPDLIELEVTESMAMSDFAVTKRRMDQLQQAGIKIAIDDFGIGFSNLQQLTRLPFDALKIDRSLIADIGKNPKSEAIIKAIVGMAHTLGHKTIAEGIETSRQHAFLQRIGCDKVQGFLFGYPMSAAALDAWEQERARGAEPQQEDKSTSKWRGQASMARRGAVRA